jgi:hypothetical protein
MEALGQLRDVVAALCAAPVSALSLEQLQDLAVEVEQQAGRLRGVASEALGEVATRQPEKETAWWWRDALGVSGESAGHAVRRAVRLRSLPLVMEAVRGGRLSLEQAGALTPLVGKVDPSVLDEGLLVDGAARRTVDSIGQWVRQLIAQHAEPAFEDEQAAAAEKRYFKHRLDPDGMVRGRFAFTAEEGELVLTILEPLARRQGIEDLRTADQRRADAVVDVFAAAAKWADLPQAGGQRVQVSYVMDAAWAAGRPGAAPASGAWAGPVTRARLESVMCDARLTRVLLDDVGQVVTLESVHGDITLAQRRAVAARDRCCVARGCTRPPAFSDVHHLRSREDGGPTSVENLVLLCRRHHVLWHLGKLALADLRVPWLRKPLDPPMVA